MRSRCGPRIMPPITGPRRDTILRLAQPIAAMGFDLGCLLRPCHVPPSGPAFPKRGSDCRRATRHTEERRMKRVVAIILGGGAGTRLYPLTKLRAKPAVPYRSRNAGYPAPPAQIRTCGFPSSGSYLGCVTAKRASGQGWRMRGCGSHRLARRTMRSQVIRCRWLRRRSTRSHSHLTCSRKASKRRPFSGTAWYA